MTPKFAFKSLQWIWGLERVRRPTLCWQQMFFWWMATGYNPLWKTWRWHVENSKRSPELNVKISYVCINCIFPEQRYIFVMCWWAGCCCQSTMADKTNLLLTDRFDFYTSTIWQRRQLWAVYTSTNKHSKQTLDGSLFQKKKLYWLYRSRHYVWVSTCPIESAQWFMWK